MNMKQSALVALIMLCTALPTAHAGPLGGRIETYKGYSFECGWHRSSDSWCCTTDKTKKRTYFEGCDERKELRKQIDEHDAVYRHCDGLKLRKRERRIINRLYSRSDENLC
jgi:hypothetical protein